MKELHGNINQLSGTVNQLSATVHQNQAKNDGAIADLKKQMSQLATSMSALTNEPGRLPSQTIQNPKANISMIRRSNMKAAREEAARPTDESNSRLVYMPIYEEF
ncbi:unnamed protein product [Rhodiola kirilowii]